MFQLHLSMYDAHRHKTEARTNPLWPPSIKNECLKHFCKSWGLSYFYLSGKLRALAGCAPHGDMWFQTLNTLRNTPRVATLWNTKIFSTGTQICCGLLGETPAHCATCRFYNISIHQALVAVWKGQEGNCLLYLTATFIFFSASAALGFAHIHIYGTAEIAKTWAEHMLLQRCLQWEGMNDKSNYLPDVGQADNSYFQWGAKPSNQRCRLWCILSLSLIKTMWKWQSGRALVIT